MNPEAPDQTATEQITRAALDYVEGWFDGDVERMRRALHPELVKRSLRTDDDGAQQLETLSAQQMIGWTADGEGRKLDTVDRRISITVHHVDDAIATATCECARYLDYLQLARTPGGWQIVNVLGAALSLELRAYVVREDGPMTTTWSAPGRVNLIGEHVDYNGGRVLPFAIDRRTEVTITRRTDRRVVVTSQGLGTAEISSPLRPGHGSGWERYVAGAIWAFVVGTGYDVAGLDIDIASTLPAGSGLSSSAAIECAVVGALSDLVGADLTPRQIAGLALRAEQEYVGVPCGPMDQYAVMLGETDHALLLDSGTLETEQVPFLLDPSGLTLLVVNTRVSHALGDGAYGDRRAACARAAEVLGVDSLGSVTLDQVLGLSDPLLRRRAHHVVSEIGRVQDVVRLLKDDRPAEIGPFLTASHRSLAEDFEVSCVELDTVVDSALDAGALGARMTGAGFGGSAIVLCRAPEARHVVEQVYRGFEESAFREPEVWSASPAAGARRLAR